MANLSTARRSALRSSSFGLPGRRKTKNRIKMEHGGAVHGSDMDFKTIRGKAMNYGRAFMDRYNEGMAAKRAANERAMAIPNKITNSIGKSITQRGRKPSNSSGIPGYQHGGAVHGSDMDFKTIRGKIQNFGRAVRDRFSPPSVSRPVSEAGTKAAIDTARQIAPAVDQMSVLKRREAAAGLNRGGMVNGLRGYKKGGMVRGYRK